MYWEPIQNSQFHNKFTMCKAVYAVIWCWALGEVCHTFITYENEAIYVNIKFLLVLSKVKISFSWAHLNVQQFKFSNDILSDIPPNKQCLKWEPIWNHHNSFTLYPALYVVMWCSATGQVSHIFITAENALISISSCCCCFCCAFDCILLLLCITQQEAQPQQQQE